MGSSKKVTVGYKYNLDMHIVLHLGSSDKLTRIRVDEREAFKGIVTGGSFYIDSPDLFGGESREGGIEGQADFETGLPNQPVNSYLFEKLGEYTSAFRGVTALVLRQMYMGLNPYLKQWEFRSTRIHKTTNGLTQWYDEKAEIRTGGFENAQSLFFAVDVSGSMDDIVSGSTTRLDIVKSQLVSAVSAVDKLRIATGVAVNVCICLWSDTAVTITRNNMDSSDKTALESFINSATASGSTNFAAPFIAAQGFFNSAISDGRKRVIFLITDGVPTNDSLPDALVEGADFLDLNSGSFSYENGTPVEVQGINIDLEDTQYTMQVTNTGYVPVVSSVNDNQLYQIIMGSLGDFSDMNPAHIIRECLTDSDWGMGYQDADIDNESFIRCADVLYAEKTGMSIMWDTEAAIEDFVKEVIKHIDGALTVDRRTGKFKLRLIRDDFEEGSLLVLNESNIIKIADFKRPSFNELTNSVSVTFWNQLIGKNSTLTVSDIALANQQGVPNQASLKYQGFTNANIASRIAQRDLKQLSTPLVTCTIYANRDADILDIGDVFKLNYPDYEVDNLVMRVTGIAFGDGKSNRVRLQCAQDVFSLPDEAYIPESPLIWQDPSARPLPVPTQLAFEVPYFELVQNQGQAEVDALLSENANAGYVAAAAVRPEGAVLYCRLFTDNGSGYEEAGQVDFSPSAVLSEDISEMQTEFEIENQKDFSQIPIGSWFQMGDELLAYLGIAGNEITVKRGVLDSVPTKHSTGEVLVFWDFYAEADPTEYVESDEVDVKLATVSGGGQLSLEDSLTSSVVLNSRAVRPYPPGDFKINGQYFLGSTAGELLITWKTRNRLQQTSGVIVGFTDGDITPEAGTTYRIDVYDTDAETLKASHSGITGTSDTFTVSELTGSINLRVELFAVRDGYNSLFPQVCEFVYTSGDNIIQFEDSYTPPAYDSVVLQFTE